MVAITIAAVFILNLKKGINIPLGSVLDDKSYDVIKKAGKDINDPSINIQIRIFAYIAKLGGWLGRRRDPISPLTLMKGMLKFNEIIEASSNYGAFMQEANRECKSSSTGLKNMRIIDRVFNPRKGIVKGCVL